MSWDSATANTIKNCFLVCRFNAEKKSQEMVCDEEEQYDKDFFQYVEIERKSF